MLLASLFSCGNRLSRPNRKEYKKIKKMERKKDANLRRAQREIDYSEVDTIYYNWRPITDTLLLGTPKIKK